MYLRERFTAYSEKQLRDFLARFYRLWSQNQWKRERYASCFHLDDYNLDPTSWCRFPILSVEIKIPESSLRFSGIFNTYNHLKYMR